MIRLFRVILPVSDIERAAQFYRAHTRCERIESPSRRSLFRVRRCHSRVL